MKGLTFLVFAVAYVRPAFPQSSALPEPAEQVIKYDTSTNLADPVALLQRRLSEGKVQLGFVPGTGYLPALLKALGVPVSSQTLVFSKTSSQADLVSPTTPRAIYFNDEVSLGWVPGASVIDLAAIDPNLGPIFYTLEQHREGPVRFARTGECLQCHVGRKTFDVPGLLVRSVYTQPDGTAMGQVDGFVNGHNSPLDLRWGGWYVTGTHVGAVHLGNTVVRGQGPLDVGDLSAGGNVTDLRGRFNTARYLTPHSDLVALLVLEHQVRMQNLITHANYETRLALDQVSRERRPGESSTQDLPAWAEQRIAVAGELLLEYMLFCDEAPLKGPVRGTSPFAAEFQRSGPWASEARSLHQLELQTRLFRYPCSFLIYSAAFDALPLEMKHYLWRRLDQILGGHDTSPAFVSLSSRVRCELFEILKETKPEFAAWLGASPASRKRS